MLGTCGKQVLFFRNAGFGELVYYGLGTCGKQVMFFRNANQTAKECVAAFCWLGLAFGFRNLKCKQTSPSPAKDFWYSASSLQNASAVGLRANRVIEVLRGPETEHDLLLRAEKQRLQLLIGSAETDLSDLRKQLKAVEETLVPWLCPLELPFLFF